MNHTRCASPKHSFQGFSDSKSLLDVQSRCNKLVRSPNSYTERRGVNNPCPQDARLLQTPLLHRIKVGGLRGLEANRVTSLFWSRMYCLVQSPSGHSFDRFDVPALMKTFVQVQGTFSLNLSHASQLQGLMLSFLRLAKRYLLHWAFPIFPPSGHHKASPDATQLDSKLWSPTQLPQGGAQWQNDP
jgi:hypothetical protein